MSVAIPPPATALFPRNQTTSEGLCCFSIGATESFWAAEACEWWTDGRGFSRTPQELPRQAQAKGRRLRRLLKGDLALCGGEYRAVCWVLAYHYEIVT